MQSPASSLKDPAYLDGQFLVAMPGIGDERFARSVIYLCAHSADGAMGIIVNRPAGSIDFPQLLVQLDIIHKVDQIKLPGGAEDMKVLKGGPVDTSRGFSSAEAQVRSILACLAGRPGRRRHC